MIMNPIQATTDYLRSAKAELEKVSWPSRRDTVRYSSLVIGVSVFMAVFFAALDMGLNRGVDLLLQRRTATGASAAPAPATSDVPLQLTPDALQATTPDGKPADIKVTPVDTKTNLPITTPAPAPSAATK